MDLQEKELIEETLEISKENNKMLKKIWRDVKYKRFITLIYWIAVIGITLGAYYYIQPIIQGVGAGYGNFTDVISSGFENIKKVNEVLPNFLDQASNLGE
ncbi:hypothetical protein KKC45_00640 [Patescibacteria group bacterium]|nr:hypothetical protein [Patescibacteria group bacterium]